MDLFDAEAIRKQLIGVGQFCYKHPAISGPLLVAWLLLTFRDVVKALVTLTFKASDVWKNAPSPHRLRHAARAVKEAIRQKGIHLTAFKITVLSAALVVLVIGS